MNKRYAVAGTAAVLALAGLAGSTVQLARDSAAAGDRAEETQRTVTARLARAGEKTEHAGSASITAKVSGLGQPKPMTVTGTYTWGRQKAFDTRVDTAGAGIADLDSQPTTRMLFVDGAYFYQVDPQPSGLLKGKHWMKVEAGAAFGKRGAAEQNRTGGDPTKDLKFLKYARDVEDAGTETVRGTAAHHYVLHVGRDQRGAAGDALSDRDSGTGGSAGGVKEITLGIWVDARTGMPVRMQETVGEAKISIDFHSFGTARTITAPPAGDTWPETDPAAHRLGTSR